MSEASYGEDANLPLPSSLPLQAYEQKLYRWLMERRYQALDWHHDGRVRDTGPYVKGVYYGTHPAVRIYYSPEVMRWLVNNRQGDLPDGTIIVKEMFKPPAQLYNLKTDPYQRTNVYNEHPEVVGELAKTLASWREKIPKTKRLGWINLKQQ